MTYCIVNCRPKTPILCSRPSLKVAQLTDPFRSDVARSSSRLQPDATMDAGARSFGTGSLAMKFQRQSVSNGTMHAVTSRTWLCCLVCSSVLWFATICSATENLASGRPTTSPKPVAPSATYEVDVGDTIMLTFDAVPSAYVDRQACKVYKFGPKSLLVSGKYCGWAKLFVNFGDDDNHPPMVYWVHVVRPKH